MGYPVMPVSIQDDLLSKTKSLLRIIRVPESVHNQVSKGAKRALIEPLARNVGIRAAERKSDWILSTNTDVLFVSPSNKKFSEIVSGLNETLWLSYRFELPEFIWDEFDRRNPIETSKKLLNWYTEGRFIRRIQVSDACGANFVIPDAVGDFQIAPSFLWEKVTGFPEDMKKGWHVDTRLTLQMYRDSGIQPQLIPEGNLLVFHQNHLRNSTSYHQISDMNSLQLVQKPYKNLQSWGLVDMDFEELRINLDSSETMKLIKGTNQFSPFVRLRESNLSELKERLDYPLGHVMNYLSDEISILPKGSVVHCFSGNADTELAVSNMCEMFGLKVIFYNIFLTEFDTKHLETLKFHLLILDCGVPSNSSFPSATVVGKSTKEMIYAGLIAYNFERIAAAFHNFKVRVAVLRAQNWATREYARSSFSLPLFNNYTSVLCGTVHESPNLNFLQRRIYLGGIIVDYGLSTEYLKGFSKENANDLSIYINSILYRYAKKIPFYLRTWLKKMILTNGNGSKGI